MMLETGLMLGLVLATVVLGALVNTACLRGPNALARIFDNSGSA